jgi:hypothetical protein
VPCVCAQSWRSGGGRSADKRKREKNIHKIFLKKMLSSFSAHTKKLVIIFNLFQNSVLLHFHQLAMSRDCKQCYCSQRSPRTDAIDFDSSVKIQNSPGCCVVVHIHTHTRYFFFSVVVNARRLCVFRHVCTHIRYNFFYFAPGSDFQIIFLGFFCMKRKK